MLHIYIRIYTYILEIMTPIPGFILAFPHVMFVCSFFYSESTDFQQYMYSFSQSYNIPKIISELLHSTTIINPLKIVHDVFALLPPPHTQLSTYLLLHH